tara:strand:- start:142 stop:249 length:108 start_codon:yes stop_codon:yes gene_type:complete
MGEIDTIQYNMYGFVKQKSKQDQEKSIENIKDMGR